MRTPRPEHAGSTASTQTPIGVRLGLFTLAAVARPAMNLLITKRWEGLHHLPRGGCIVCPNHLTEIDPLVVGHLLYSNGILPYFLAKDSLFRLPLAGAWLRWAGQIPVDRSGIAGMESLAVARRALARSGAIVIYPEGTLTRDPGMWPMRGRTGAARLALQTQAPVIPVAHWGAQELLPRYARRLYILPRKTVRVAVGAPVDLTDLAGRPLDRATLEEATARIQDATAALLAPLRGACPPPSRFDPALPRTLA